MFRSPGDVLGLSPANPRRFHDLRHGGPTAAAQTGASLTEVMARGGHSTPRAALIYQHAAKSRGAEIAAAMSVLAQAARRSAKRWWEGLKRRPRGILPYRFGSKVARNIVTRANSPDVAAQRRKEGPCQVAFAGWSG